MSETPRPAPGSISWTDLTVGDAVNVRDFYQRVVGWTSQPVAMGGYDDFCMIPPGSEQPVAGICHARGPNAELPPQWIIYIVVEDLDASLAKCRDCGGKVLHDRREPGHRDGFAIIEDPAGAIAALYQAPDQAQTQ